MTSSLVAASCSGLFEDRASSASPSKTVSGLRSSCEASDTNCFCRVAPWSRRSNIEFSVAARRSISSLVPGRSRRSCSVSVLMRAALRVMASTGRNTRPVSNQIRRPKKTASAGITSHSTERTWSTLRSMTTDVVSAETTKVSPLAATASIDSISKSWLSTMTTSGNASIVMMKSSSKKSGNSSRAARSNSNASNSPTDNCVEFTYWPSSVSTMNSVPSVPAGSCSARGSTPSVIRSAIEASVA